MMPVRLRGHHFLCMLTYRGYGYTPDFVANMSAIVDGIAEGRPARLIEGPDDICAGLTAADRTACDHDCGRQETRRLDAVAVAEIGQALAIDFGRDVEIGPELVSRLRRHFATRAIRGACHRCPWSDFCTAIAGEDFAGTRLFPPREAGASA